MKSLQVLVIVFALIPIGLAQSTQPVRLTPAELHADVAILRQAYEQLHPGLYRYNSKSEMDAAFAALDRQFDHDQSLQDAFLAFSEFAAKVRCGHTQANPFNQSKAVVEALFKSPTRLPFYFAWLDGRMVVTRDFTPQKVLPPGTEVLTINGVGTGEILSRLMTIARADGSNDAKRIAQLAVTGDSEYEAFDLYFPMYFPLRARDYKLVVRKPVGKAPQVLRVAPLTFAQRVAPIELREAERKGGDQALFEWKYLSDGSAYLAMQTWALYQSKWQWKAWLDQHLNEAADRQAPALILDLRGNEGGNDVGNVILAHLVDEPLRLSLMERLVRYRKVPDNLAPYLDTWDRSFLDWGNDAVELDKPWPTAPPEVSYRKLLRDGDDPDAVVIKPEGKRFRGRVIVLTDASNSSATFQFAQAVQSHHLGTLVGEATGGSQRGINGGAFFFLRLPHSGIEMDVPLIGTFPATPMPDAGIAPNVVVKPTLADIADGKDAVLAAAQRLSGAKGELRGVPRGTSLGPATEPTRIVPRGTQPR